MLNALQHTDAAKSATPQNERTVAVIPDVNSPFDPSSYAVVLPRIFEQLEIGEVFRAPSRTVTDAHA